MADSTADPTDSSVFGRNPTTTFHHSSPVYSAFWHWSPSARLTNDLRAGGSLSRFSIENSLRSQFDFIAVLDDPSVPLSQPMAGLDVQQFNENLRSYQDDASWIKGRHTLQVGAWFQQYSLQTSGADVGSLDSTVVPRYVVSDIARDLPGKPSLQPRLPHVRIPCRNRTFGPFFLEYAIGVPARHVAGLSRIVRHLRAALRLSCSRAGPGRRRRHPRPFHYAIAGRLRQDSAFTFASTAPFYHKDTDDYGYYLGLAWAPFKRLPLAIRGGSTLSNLNDNLLSNLSILTQQNPFQTFSVSAGSPATLSSLPRHSRARPPRPAHFAHSPHPRQFLSSAAAHGIRCRPEPRHAQSQVLACWRGSRTQAVHRGCPVSRKPLGRGPALGRSKSGHAQPRFPGHLPPSALRPRKRHPFCRLSLPRRRRPLLQLQPAKLPAQSLCQIADPHWTSGRTWPLVRGPGL